MPLPENPIHTPVSPPPLEWVVGSTFELTIPLPKKANLGLGTAHPDGTPELTGKGRTRRRPQPQQPNLRVEAPASPQPAMDALTAHCSLPKSLNARKPAAARRREDPDASPYNPCQMAYNPHHPLVDRQ